MEVEEEAKCRRKLDQRKKMQKELREFDRLSFVSKEMQESLSDSLQHQLQEVEERRNDIFCGIEHRLRKEEMEEQFNKEAKEGWRFAASAARITEENAGDEDRKHTSGGVFVGTDSNLGAVVGAQEGAIGSILGHEDRIAQAWVNVRGGLRFSQFACGIRKDGRREMKHCWKQFCKELGSRSIQWLIACDANMSLEDFETSLWFRTDQVHVIAPEGVSTCRSKNAKGELVEKVYDYAKACSSQKGEISDMKVIEDFESRPHKAVTFVVERGKEKQEWNEQELPKAQLGYSGGRLPGRSTEEKGREEGEECDCSQIENEEEEESWQEGDQMAEQWEDEQHLEEWKEAP